MKKDLLEAIHENNKDLMSGFHKDNIEGRRWIVGTILTVGFGLAGLMIELLRH